MQNIEVWSNEVKRNCFLCNSLVTFCFCSQNSLLAASFWCDFSRGNILFRCLLFQEPLWIHTLLFSRGAFGFCNSGWLLPSVYYFNKFRILLTSSVLKDLCIDRWSDAKKVLSAFYFLY